MYPGFHASTIPDKTAVVMASTGERISYKELDDRSARLAQLLWSRGLRPGDGIALFAENHPRYFEIYWAALRSGLYLTAINRNMTADEAAYLVNDSESKVLLSTARMATTAEEMLPLIGGCAIRIMMDTTAPGFESYEELVAIQPAAPLVDQPRGDVMLYSSGTTGRPKGIKRSLSGTQVGDPNAPRLSMLESMLFGMSEKSVYLCPAPLYHSAALQWSAGVHELGGTLVVMEKFDPKQFLHTVEREHVTHTQVVPTMLVRILKLPNEVRHRFDVSSLECVIHAAAPCPVDVKRQVIEWLGPIVSEFYGGTEGAGLTFLTATEWLAHPGSVGKPIVGTLHICDGDGVDLAAGEIGDIYFEQEKPAFEYHRDKAKTQSSRHPKHENWAALGDIGYVDTDGYLFLTDRRSFTIISGGVNIYPAEIESRLVMHPAVGDVAVFGLPDPEMGEYVHAVVQPAPGASGSSELADELRDYVREQLAGFKVPRTIDFRDQLPRQDTGKLYKKQLRDEYLLPSAERMTSAGDVIT